MFEAKFATTVYSGTQARKAVTTFRLSGPNGQQEDVQATVSEAAQDGRIATVQV